MARMTISTAHRMVARPDRFHLALMWFRLLSRRPEQLKLRLDCRMEAGAHA
jgi:hypothetical protein